MSDAKSRILARLRAAPAAMAPELPAWTPPPPDPDLGPVARYRRALEAWRGEVHETTAADWPRLLAEILAAKGVRRVVYGPATNAGRRLAAAWGQGGTPELVAYDRPVEALKETLVDGVDAGFTTARGAVADTGTLVLWPTVDEPRLLSLLPPIHVALLEAATIRDNLAEAIAAEDWAAALPTNALLISGPSKTADIEQTLAFGVHGPRELVVLIVHS